ncbi:VacJ family lipoprotein [Alcaligenaceae bacterium]|nr:VacJ family lipoprotein [Alcaligenaceae bacterium]
MTSYATSTVPKTPARWTRIALISTAAALATGCASVPNPSPNDPLERYNRSMFAVNEAVDNALFKPIANGYVALTPQPMRTCVSNVFNNMTDVWSAFNSFLQARGHDFFNTLGRVMFNTTMGLGGCIDVASMNGSKRIHNDFGVTLGVWGLGSGPYIVLPFLGASDLRDGVGMLGAFAADFSAITPVFAIDNIPVRNSILGLYAVDTRVNLLDADKLVDEIALDRYSFIRDAYMQRRNSLVNSRLHGNGQLPDYSDDLPDYSDPDDTDNNIPTATPAAQPAN